MLNSKIIITHKPRKINLTRNPNNKLKNLKFSMVMIDAHTQVEIHSVHVTVEATDVQPKFQQPHPWH